VGRIIADVRGPRLVVQLDHYTGLISQERAFDSLGSHRARRQSGRCKRPIPTGPTVASDAPRTFQPT
jgi:hypothetical protein